MLKPSVRQSDEPSRLEGLAVFLLLLPRLALLVASQSTSLLSRTLNFAVRRRVATPLSVFSSAIHALVLQWLFPSLGGARAPQWNPYGSISYLLISAAGQGAPLQLPARGVVYVSERW